MHLSLSLTVLAAIAQVTLASPAQDAKEKEGLRLVKTSEADAGTWVSEEEEVEKFKSKGVAFVDITDIKDEEVLAKISDPNANATAAANRVPYPESMQHVDEANSFISRISTSTQKSWMRTLTNYHNRYVRSRTGAESAQWLYNEVSKIASANRAIKVRQFRHSFNQPSVIATIPGQSSDLVIVGAHFDSINSRSTSGRAPGADDNASGTVVAMEALRVLAEGGFKPKNTLEFHLYGGEEVGLLGSKDIFADYKAASKRVLAFVNGDMTGYSRNGKIAVYTDYVDSALTDYAKLAVTQYSGAGAPNTDRCGYGCSDHFSGWSNGFPSAYVCADTMAGSSPYIHTDRDTYDTIMWPTMLRHAKFTVGFLVEASHL